MNVLLQTAFASFRRKSADFAAARSAIAAVEFAIIMPALMIFMLGGGEAARYVNVSRALTNLAFEEANLVAERPSGSSPMTSNDVIFVQEATPVTFPGILAQAKRLGGSGKQAWSQDLQFTLSSVLFTASPAGCKSGCTYNAAVSWSIADGTGASPRSCAVAPVSAPDTAEPSLTTLPADVFTSGSVIVVDLVYTYTPVFGGSFFKPVTLRRSAYLQPRYLSQIYYSGPLAC